MIGRLVFLITDGSCIGNPGPGGWAFRLCYGTHVLEKTGGQKDTTNNRMELTAVIEGLRALKRPCKVHLTTDSQYIATGAHKDEHGLLRCQQWKVNGWRGSNKKQILNSDLWNDLLWLLQYHEVEVSLIEGQHDMHSVQGQMDFLAHEAAKRVAMDAPSDRSQFGQLDLPL